MLDFLYGRNHPTNTIYIKIKFLLAFCLACFFLFLYFYVQQISPILPIGQ